MNFTKFALRRGVVAALLVALTLPLAHCEEEEDTTTQDLGLLLGAIALRFQPTNPGSCSFTFGSRTVPIQEYDVAANGNSSFTNGFTGSFKQWAAVKLPSVTNGTTVTFSYEPWYSVGGNTYYLVYEESACPLNNESSADFNYTFPDLQTQRTPTNYTVSGNTLTFNSNANGKSFIIVSAADAVVGTEAVARTN